MTRNESTGLIRAAEALLDQEKFKLAQKKLSDALKIDSESISAHFYLALAELGMKHLEKAEEHAIYVLKKDPCRANAHLNLGVIKLRQGDLPSAMRLYRKELTVYPNCYQAHYNLGRNYMDFKKWSRVVFHLEKCWRAKHHGNHLEDMLSIAAQRTVPKRIDLEKEIYTRAVRKNRNDIWALNNLAAILMGEAQYAKAIRLLKEALKLDPSDPVAGRNFTRTQKYLKGSRH